MCACGALAVSAGAFSLVSPGHKARIVVAPGEETCVLLAARDLAADVKKYRNGVVRKILPKGSPFDAILDEEMRRIDRILNDRPLKCLNWRTPREAYTALLHRHLLAAA